MPDDILVSIIVPVFNTKMYLDECIGSIVKQSYQNIEILLMNDGSTDGSSEVLAEWCKKDARLRRIDKKNTGYGDTVNQGIAAAKGKYIIIIESDDFVESDMVDKLLTLAEENRADFVKANYYEFQYGQKTLKGNLNRCICGQIFSSRENMMKFTVDATVWSCIYRTDFLKENDIYFLPTPGASYQDIGFIFKVFVAAERGYFTREAFVNYRLDNENASVKSKDKAFAVQKELEASEGFLRKRNLEKSEFSPWLMKSRLNVYRWNLSRISLQYVDAFFKLFAEEIKRDILNGRYRKDLYDLSEQEYIKALAGDFSEPLKEIEQGKMEEENRSLYCRLWRELIEKEPAVYIYGAGKVGRRIYSRLKRSCLNCCLQFVCTEKQENQGVITPDQISDKNSLIIIGISDLQEKARIYADLRKRGFSRILMWDSSDRLQQTVCFPPIIEELFHML